MKKILYLLIFLCFNSCDLINNIVYGPYSLIEFKFLSSKNESLETDLIVSSFDYDSVNNNYEAYLIVPIRTDRTILVASFTITSGFVYIDDVVQISGETVNDFSNEITYTVKSEDGNTKYKFIIRVVWIIDSFEDSRLEESIRDYIDKPNETIYSSDLDKITYLNASNSNINNDSNNKISDLSGIWQLQNLQSLNLAYNAISDICELSKLTDLEYLNLSNNNIVDIDALKYLTKLEELDLGNNEIVDINSINALINLEFLDMGGNKIVDINSLSMLTNIDYLYLYNNYICDIRSLTSLEKLRELNLFANSIDDISCLIGNDTIRMMFIEDNGMSILQGSNNYTLIKSFLDRGALVFFKTGNITDDSLEEPEVNWP